MVRALPLKTRIAFCVPALLLVMLTSWLRNAYISYWVLNDGAVITVEGNKGKVYYTYSVAGVTYSGRSLRDWRDERYSQVVIGDRSPMWYSISHPWLSSLPKPESLASGLPLLIIFLPLELFFLFVIFGVADHWENKLARTRPFSVL